MRSRVAFSIRSLVPAVVLAGVCAATFAACGGSQEPPPAPLSHHFDDTFIAALPVDQQTAATNEPQLAHRTAKLERAKAESDLAESNVQIQIAGNERDAAKLDVSSARSRKTAADSSADQTRINDATRELKAAEKFSEALNERINYLRAYQTWLKTLLTYTEENMYWRESQYELAMAELASRNNIQPKGFVYKNFVTQQGDRQKKTEKRKARAEAERTKAMAARSKWLALQTEADKLLGKTSQFSDPMAPSNAPAPAGGGDMTRGAGGSTLGGGGATSDSHINPTGNPTGNPAGSLSKPDPTPEPAPAPSDSE